MTRISHSSRHSDPSEAKRWLIVGAYQAGAPEKQVARIAGLSRTAVRHIILNYQRTGSPSIPKKLSSKIKLKPIVEYDEDGNLIDSDEEQEQEQEGAQQTQSTPTIKKSPKIINNITAKKLTAYVLNQAHNEQTAWRPPTPPRDTNTRTPTPPASDGGQPYPPSPPMNDPVPRLPGPTKFDQTIRGYEVWTHKDDMTLLNHVLNRLQGGRCHRWHFLRKLLLKGMAQPDSVLQQWKKP
ncbi:hypothetical protein CLU79DRAFT_834122 [Phycomyces nitens]|nr:hypothetical protein CLU79DRAFT_834122 [Phycomyces nitens]